MAKLPNWTTTEISILENNITKTNKELELVFASQGFPYRTTTSIEQKRRKLGLENKTVYWSSEDIQILLDNYETLEDKEISDSLLPHKSVGAINQKRFSLGLVKNSKWTEEDDKVLKDNYEKGLKVCLALLPHHPKESILTHANDLGLRVNMSELMRTYRYKRDYFSKLTLENCYWAGFIAADGCIHDDGTLTIELAIKDKKHLDKFANAVCYTGSLREYKYSRGNLKDVHKICLALTTAKQIAHDLQQYFNITPRKTRTYEAPTELTLNQQIAFSAGYIDGDGSIFCATKNNMLNCSVVGNESMMLFIKSVFDTVINLPEKGIRGTGSLKQQSTDKYSYPFFKYSITGQRAITILQKIKELPLPFLERKWSKVPTLDENKVI